MPRKPKVTLSGLEFVQKLKNEIRDQDRLDHLTLSHRVAVSSQKGAVPVVFTIELTPGRNGRFVATCREFQGLFVAGADELDTLTQAELEIRHRLAAGRRSSPI